MDFLSPKKPWLPWLQFFLYSLGRAVISEVSLPPEDCPYVAILYASEPPVLNSYLNNRLFSPQSKRQAPSSASNCSWYQSSLCLLCLSLPKFSSFVNMASGPLGPHQLLLQLWSGHASEAPNAPVPIGHLLWPKAAQDEGTSGGVWMEVLWP